MNIFQFCTLLAIILLGCNTKTETRTEPKNEVTSNPIKQLDWILGTWEMKTATGSLYESWVIASDSSFNGKSFKIKKTGDTIPLENVLLTYRNKRFFYNPTVSDQNNQEQVTFELTSMNPGAFVAENREHDFPQRISYKRSNDRMDAWIDGQINGEYNKEEFSYVRLK